MRRAALLTATLFVVACSGGGAGPSPTRTATPTSAPTSTPTAAPTTAPTLAPTASPTAAPARTPTTAPTATPTSSSTRMPTATPVATPTLAPTTTPTATPNQSAYTCPTSNTASVVREPSTGEATHRMPAGRGARFAEPAPNLLAVTYDESDVRIAGGAIAARERQSGASFVREYEHAYTHLVTRIVAVAPASLASAAAALRTRPGVVEVTRTGYKRRALSVTAPYFPNDPYFKGFSGSSAPLYETASIPGEWDKHVERLEDAFAYSQSGNGSSVQNANALGKAGVKIAVIDTGEDTSHPELSSKITYTKCFITNPSNVQSVSNFETDPLGHGTDVSGIAAAATGNDLGFTGSGGNASIWAYRVFPTPDDNCNSDTTNDPQCEADTRDIASAIEDATNRGVNVISISLGGGVCTNGNDPDSTEGAAMANAIAAGIIVVAAAGNDGESTVSAPACDTNVIAAGATSLADGAANGTGGARGSASNPTEYLASYSNYGSPGASVNSAGAWGIVSPGGDPSSDTDADDLHWIENIWTSTPFDSNFSGSCTPDFQSSSADDCRTLIAGTSMSAPNVAGAAALILAVNSSYQSASAMKTLLCQTADDISDPHEGCGRLDVYRAMAKALGDPSPPAARPVP